ncbi:AraC family transcriptional regulator [Anaerotalea alkaliphila]|uniref:AraC family transcriptional regulator n=1 Tax=Anaerotalea alkaliphila TaxID=2662126 RepID=A0A7X5HV19_9FIRM|nr:AraC family transcriptional regulator [Anaerotalea alkaliphila]NDL67168.1 AraC family transcriptional regulator [Anaerotalea alkaliphila]
MQYREKGVLPPSTMFHHIPTAFARSHLFHATSAGHFHCGQDYHIEKQGSESFLLLRVLQGEGYAIQKQKEFPLRKDTLVLLNRYEEHRYGTQTQMEFQWVVFDGNASPAYYHLLVERGAAAVDLPPDSTQGRLVEAILSEMALSDFVNEHAVSSMLHNLLGILATTPTSPEGFHLQVAKDIIQTTVDHIHANYSKPMTLKDLADHVSLSPYHFSRLFKQGTGYSPYEYLINHRMKKAQELLKKTGMPIKEISFHLGFSSESYFISSFKQHVGYTPAKYRRLLF